MSYTITESKQYEFSAADVTKAALGAIEGLEGKLGDQTSDASGTTISATFHKTILGKVLGDRTQMTATIQETAAEQAGISVEIYPLDAVGRKLEFGARAGVAQTVMTWFIAHLEHRLPK